MFRHQIHSAGIVKRLRHAFFVLSAPENTGGSIFKAPYFLLRIRHFWHILPDFFAKKDDFKQTNWSKGEATGGSFNLSNMTNDGNQLNERQHQR